MGCTQPAVSGALISPPFTATGAVEQLIELAGAAAGARQTFPALPPLPQTRPVGHPFPESQESAQYSPVDSCTHLFPEGQVPPLPHREAQTPPGKSALSRQVRPLAQLGVQLAEPRSGVVPEHAAPSAASSRPRDRERARTRTTERSR